MTQGQLGSVLARAVDARLRSRCGGRRRHARLVVDDDPAFGGPDQADRPVLHGGGPRSSPRARGWAVVEDAGRGYRRVVASPRPVERPGGRPRSRTLLGAGHVVLAGGGGGVAVAGPRAAR